MTESQLVPILGSIVVAVVTWLVKSLMDRWMRRGDAFVAFQTRAFETASAYHEDLVRDNARYREENEELRRENESLHAQLHRAKIERDEAETRAERLEVELTQCQERERGTW